MRAVTGRSPMWSNPSIHAIIVTEGLARNGEAGAFSAVVVAAVR
jgi:hypothetical protein